jgi:PKD repeat protein
MRKIALLFTIVLITSSIAYSQEDETIKFYNSYIEATKNAKSINDLKPYLSQANVSQLGEITKEDETLFLEIVKDERKKIKITNISSKIKNDTAILTVDGTDTSTNEPVDGIVYLVKENGKWKFVQEEYITDTVIE